MYPRHFVDSENLFLIKCDSEKQMLYDFKAGHANLENVQYGL